MNVITYSTLEPRLQSNHCSSTSAITQAERVGAWRWLNRPGTGIPKHWEYIDYDPQSDTYTLANSRSTVTLNVAQDGVKFSADGAEYLAPKYFEGLPFEVVVQTHRGTYTLLRNPTGIRNKVRSGGVAYVIPRDESDLTHMRPIGGRAPFSRWFDNQGNPGMAPNPRRDGVGRGTRKLKFVTLCCMLESICYGEHPVLKHMHGKFIDVASRLDTAATSRSNTTFYAVVGHARMECEARFILADDRVDGQRIAIHGLTFRPGRPHVWMEVLNADGTIKRELPSELDGKFDSDNPDEWIKKALNYMDDCAVMDCLPLL